MFYDAELKLLQKSFKKLGLQSLLINPREPLDSRVNLGLGKLLGNEEFYQHTFYHLHPVLAPRTVYKLRDNFGCQYLFFLLPEAAEETVMAIGPYLTKEMSRQQFLEQAENIEINPRHVRHLEKYYSVIPFVPENSHAFVFLESFYDTIWGEEGGYVIEEIKDHFANALSPATTPNAPLHAERTNWNIELIEERYTHENMLMELVSTGQPHKADLLFASFSALPFEKRAADPVRNIQNYGIILNTLLRKAAEKGGVHPVYLDSASSEFAKKIENSHTVGELETLMKEMFLSYCHLVQKLRLKDYSAPVQRTILYIDTELARDLSLTELAALQDLSPGYLSALFHKETGQTLTHFINQRRVDLAIHLLTNTNLQIQTIAQHCGMVDVHYFSKVFKKYTGKTPKEYRKG